MIDGRALTVEQTAIDLVTEGTKFFAEDELNEVGDLALDMARAIRENPRSFTEWCEAMGVRWDKGA